MLLDTLLGLSSLRIRRPRDGEGQNVEQIRRLQTVITVLLAHAVLITTPEKSKCALDMRFIGFEFPGTYMKGARNGQTSWHPLSGPGRSYRAGISGPGQFLVVSANLDLHCKRARSTGGFRAADLVRCFFGFQPVGQHMPAYTVKRPADEPSGQIDNLLSGSWGAGLDLLGSAEVCLSWR